MESPTASAQPTPQDPRDWLPPPEYLGALVDDLLPIYQEVVRELESDLRLGFWELAQVRDDLPRMHQLMSDWGLLTQGQWELFLGSSAAERVVPDSDALRRFRARCRVARLWVEAWRKGRSRRIDRSTLERSGAVSDTFIDRVSELLREVEGDPNALLRRLPKVHRFGPSKIEKLGRWLVEHGYLSLDEPLELQEREVRVLQDAAGLLEPGEGREIVRWLEGGLRDATELSPDVGRL